MSARSRARAAPRRRERVGEALLWTCCASCLAFILGIVSRLAGFDEISSAAVLVSSAIGGGSWVVHRLLAARLRRRLAATLATSVALAAGVPAMRTLYPGSALVSGTLAAPGEEVRVPSPSRRPLWLLVAADVEDDRIAWWGEYELRIDGVELAGELGRVPSMGVRRGPGLLRRSGHEVRARYHRIWPSAPVDEVRLTRVAGNVPRGLDVSVYREPLSGSAALGAWLVGALAMTLADVRWSFRGALGLAAMIPLTVSAFTWLAVTPVAPLEDAFHAMVLGTAIGAPLGVGAARVAAMARLHLGARRKASESSPRDIR